MNFLWIALLVVLVLVILYLVARWVKPFGQSLAFVCVVASRILVTLALSLSNAAVYCHDACLASLHYPPGLAGDDYWQGINVISRVVYFVIAVCILVGETLNTLLVLPSLFHTSSRFQLPGFVELASAALFICTPALFGAVLLECCGLIPHGAGLFPRMGKLLRWVIGVLSTGFLLLSILLTAYFYLFRGAYLLDPETAQGMSVYILGGLGLLIAAVSVVALWALVVGSAGVVSLVLWMGEKACEVLTCACSLVPELFDVLALHLSGGTIGVGGTQIARAPHHYLSFATNIPPSALDEETETIIPVETQEMEIPMHYPDKHASIVFVDTFGSKMFTPVAQAIAALRASGSILTSAYLDLSITHVHTALAGIVDRTPAPELRKAALLQSETEEQAYTTLLNQLADMLIETHLATKAAPAPLIFIIDSHCLRAAASMLGSLKHRLPLHSLIVVTSVSAYERQNTQVQAGMTALLQLHAQDIIETVLVIDPHSPFASAYGEETQHHFLAQTVISLLIAHKHHLHNPSCTTVVHGFHPCSAFTAVSFASEVVAVGDMPKRWSWLPLRAGSAGTGNYSDILAQTRVAIDRCVTEEDTRSFVEHAAVRMDAPCTLVVNVPIAIHDSRFSACVRDTSLYIGTYYPSATAITVRANGCPYPRHLGGRFLVQASCLYPLSPALFPTVQEAKQEQGTSVYPLPSAILPTNGHQPLNSQEAVIPPPNKKTARSLTRAAKTPSTPHEQNGHRTASTK